MDARNAVSAPRGFRLFSPAGAGFAVFWLVTSFLVIPPAPAAAAEGATLSEGSLLNGGTFGSLSEGPIRRRGPYHHSEDYDRRDTPYGFMNLGGGVFDPANQPGSGFYGNLAVGTEVAKPLDLGVLVSWYHRSAEGEEFISSYIDEGGNIVQQTIQTQSVDTDLIPLMGIARLRFPLSPYFQPYVGGGAGYEWLFVEGDDDLGHFSNDYGAFGAMAMAGLNIGASRTVALYGEAVYNFSSPSRQIYDPNLNITVKESIDMNGLGVHGGLRFRF